MRRHLTRCCAALLALILGTVGAQGVTGPAAGAAAEPDSLLVTCYDGAVWQYTSVSPTTLTAPGNTAFTTTTRCLDINMRKSTTATWSVQACVIFVDHTSSCNYWTELSTSWKTIATNVADNTHFKVMVIHDWPNANGTTAMQLAF
ncbi:hypothetical protein [Micromonospora echinofusca]|uniref:Secreted protein n=1 Tax=Micromonospora echinofusca TaxID=47858 RepID=A0ABS3W0C2_MICEH|nr:hypothetical protein [Micromonospora echinofusca]MBO4210218.1 hypothetical protein [Micromonospora echinofusca]